MSIESPVCYLLVTSAADREDTGGPKPCLAKARIILCISHSTEKGYDTTAPGGLSWRDDSPITPVEILWRGGAGAK